jgi:superoxide dismutase, Fe-Mn family
VGHLAGGTPILIMDVFEHAYMIDYLLDRKAYIEAFFQNINWQVSAQRYQAEPKST